MTRLMLDVYYKVEIFFFFPNHSQSRFEGFYYTDQDQHVRIFGYLVEGFSFFSSQFILYVIFDGFYYTVDQISAQGYILSLYRQEYYTIYTREFTLYDLIFVNKYRLLCKIERHLYTLSTINILFWMNHPKKQVTLIH